jgi:RHS repeat-associated protein
VFAKYPTVSGAASNASYSIRDGNGANTSKSVNQTTGGGTWASLGSFTFKRDGSGQQISLSDNANGAVLADAVKLVRNNTGETDNEKADFAYAYDPNANLTDITDNSPGTKIDAYTITYSAVNLVASIQEKLSGTVKHTTTFGYNANNHLTTRTHDDESATYQYDIRDLVSQITDKDSSSDPSPKVTNFTYTPRGQRDVQTKGNGNTVDADYFLDGLLQHQVEKKPNGAIVSEHTLTYDPNSNKTQDVAKKMNADNHAAFINTTTAWDYDPLDRIKQVTKTGDVTSTETYIHDPNNNVTSQTIKGATTTFTYDRNRLLTSATGGATASYNYDPFGRLDTVTSAGQVIERETYDGFDRIAEHQQKNPTGTLVSTKYTYDPLDRTATKTTDSGGPNEKTTDYSYLGLSDQVLDEDVAGSITKTYRYTPWGERLSQAKTNTDGSKEDSYYGYNDHTDVETLTDTSGDTKATYGYTAYGQTEDAETSGIDKPDTQDPTKEPYNPYRYEAKRFDPGSGTYDMGFRDYSPGLNQFLVRDAYNGALDDQNLTADPFTNNRYAFAGGNPVGGVELDGHTIDGGGACGYRISDPCNSGTKYQPEAFIDFGGMNLTTPHNRAVYKTGINLAKREIARGNFDFHITLDLSFPYNPNSAIPGSGPKGGTGYADIILRKRRNVYIWEIKPGTSQAGPALDSAQQQLDRYVRGLQRKLGQGFRVVPGDYLKPDETSGPGGVGTVKIWSRKWNGLRFYSWDKNRKSREQQEQEQEQEQENEATQPKPAPYNPCLVAALPCEHNPVPFAPWPGSPLAPKPGTICLPVPLEVCF